MCYFARRAQCYYHLSPRACVISLVKEQHNTLLSFLYVFQKAYPARLKSLNYYNTGAVFEAVMEIFKPLLSKKLRERVGFQMECYNSNSSAKCIFAFTKICYSDWVHVFTPICFRHFCQKETITMSFSMLKDSLPHLFHGFRNKYFNKISLDNMLYFLNYMYLYKF